MLFSPRLSSAYSSRSSAAGRPSVYPCCEGKADVANPADYRNRRLLNCCPSTYVATRRREGGMLTALTRRAHEKFHDSEEIGCAAHDYQSPFHEPMSMKSPAQGSPILSAKAKRSNNKRHPRRSADVFRSPTPGESAVGSSTTVIIHGTGGICNNERRDT